MKPFTYIRTYRVVFTELMFEAKIWGSKYILTVVSFTPRLDWDLDLKMRNTKYGVLFFKRCIAHYESWKILF